MEGGGWPGTPGFNYTDTIDKDNITDIEMGTEWEVNNKNNIPRNDHYKLKKIYTFMDADPYKVFVESTDKSIKGLHPMKVGKLIFFESPQIQDL